MGQVLITGASGFIGRNLVAHLLAENYEVLSWVRKKPDEAHSHEVMTGSLSDAANHVRSNKRISAVIHLAAIVAPFERSKTLAINVDATKELAVACSARENPPTFIYVSSLSASGPGQEGVPRIESDQCTPRSLYGESKHLAELALHSLADRLPISIVRPPAVFGPWDRNLLQLFKMIRIHLHLIGISQHFRYSFLHVADLANGIQRVIEKGHRLEPFEAGSSESPGKGTYFLADPTPVTFRELGNFIASSTKTSPPWNVTVPRSLCWALAGISELGGRYLNIQTFLNFDKLREATGGSWVCDPSKATREIGFEISASMSQRVDETATWYREHGWI